MADVRSVCVWAVIAGAAASGSGCGSRGAAPPPEIGSYAYVAGELLWRVDQGVVAVLPIVRAALAEAGYAGVGERRSADGWAVVAEDARGRRTLIRLRPDGSGTRVAISIGTVGDERASAELFQRIADASRRQSVRPTDPEPSY